MPPAPALPAFRRPSQDQHEDPRDEPDRTSKRQVGKPFVLILLQKHF